MPALGQGVSFTEALEAIKSEHASLVAKRDMHKAAAKDVTERINELKKMLSLTSGTRKGGRGKKKNAESESVAETPSVEAENTEVENTEVETASLIAAE